MSRVFERLSKKRMSQIIKNLNILPDHKLGFRNNHRTTELWHRVMKIIRETLEKKLYCGSKFLGIKQAFARVWHTGLLYKLKKEREGLSLAG